MRKLLPFGLGVTLLLAGCGGLIFQPMKDWVRTPGDVGLAYEDVYFRSPDGIVLHGWFLPTKEKPKGLVLFFHGNAENISTHLGSVWWLPAQGYQVFLLDYRGYGRSEGTPTLDGVELDVRAALEKVRSRPDVDPARVVVFGQSLGGAVALTSLSESPYKERIRGMMVEGAFADYHQIAREKLSEFWLTWPFQWPLSLTLPGGRIPLRSIGAFSPVPVLIIHGEEDKIIPPHHAEQLFQAAGQPKQIWRVPLAGHIQALSTPKNRKRMVDYLDHVLNGAPNPFP